MRIACIGNMNNMMFTLCRYLRDNGYDANLFCFKDEAVNFLPGTDSFDADKAEELFSQLGYLAHYLNWVSTKKYS